MLNKKDCYNKLGLVSMFVQRTPNKTAVMFGLDARIALAIFGALSVITGAALYGAIANAKTVAIITELNEIGKAFEQYYLDTGKTLSRYSSTTTSSNYHVFQGFNLLEDSGVKGAKSPYLSYAKNGTFSLDYPKFTGGYISLLVLESNGTLGGANSRINALCTAGETCSLWIRVIGTPQNIFDAIDDKIDNGDGDSAGSVRFYVSGKYMFYKYMPLINTLG